MSRPPIDLIVCDEGTHRYGLYTEVAHDITGHRLKSSSNKTRETFNDFRTQRRIILSGTPIQNDLREFHAMVILFLIIARWILIPARR
jgi:DNA repair and recombination protein RAD54B